MEKRWLPQSGRLRNIKTLILTGMQTEYCIDATCKAAFEYGYEVLIPEGTVISHDNRWMDGKSLNEFYTHIWDGRFARCMSIELLERTL